MSGGVLVVLFCATEAGVEGRVFLRPYESPAMHSHARCSTVRERCLSFAGTMK